MKNMIDFFLISVLSGLILGMAFLTVDARSIAFDALYRDGFTEIKMNGPAFYGCPPVDFSVKESFSAIKDDSRVSGVVCVAKVRDNREPAYVVRLF